ncbi:unnamed protein product [Rotaria sp. Silwood2]|nr:unnamed protein product [Rotaria sp. Silwood2]CAF4482912.1 unnamed protein product [Rotaria sp. Silwood2]
MKLHRPLSHVKQSDHNMPTISQTTMDTKFIVVLFCVETGAWGFNSIHVKAPEIHIYNSYNQKPILYNQSSQIYLCFLTINHCIYEHKQLRFLKVMHLIFVSIIVVCYFSLFTIMLRKWENAKVQNDLDITWYSAIELLVLLTLALHTLLMVIIYERDYINIKHCNENSRLIRGENLFTYVVLTRQAEHIAPSEDSTLITKQNLSPAESFETVNQEFIKEFI